MSVRLLDVCRQIPVVEYFELAPQSDSPAGSLIMGQAITVLNAFS